MAAAYEPRTGKRVWIRKLDGPAGWGPLNCGELVALVRDSIYLLRPESGKIVRRFSWKDDGVNSAAPKRKAIVGQRKADTGYETRTPVSQGTTTSASPGFVGIARGLNVTPAKLFGRGVYISI